MGNKNSSASHDDTLDDGSGTARRRNKSSNKSTRKKNALSCPNLDVTTGGEGGKSGGGAGVSSPDRPKTDEELDIKIMRSFSSTQDMLRGSTMISPEPEVDIKVYRRSTATLSRAQSSGNSRSATLPRNMGRSRSINTGGFQSGGAGGTGTMPRDEGARMRTSSIDHKSASASARKKLNSTAETVEFGPDAQVIKKNLSEFEKQFVRHLTDLYGDLSEFIQLSALAIAVGPLPASCHPVSLWEYLNSDRLPIDLLEPSSPDDDGNSTAEYRLTIPTSMFHGVMHIRRDRVDGQPERISLAQELFMCLAVEVAGELARMFEYQIGLLAGPTVVDILAKHAADCAMEYLKSNNRFMDLNTVVHGVVHGHIHIPPDQQKIISVIVGEREFKWLLEDIFKKPGLMKKKTIGVTSEAETLRLPWRFFTNECCDPATYGYRTVIMERYYATGSCRPSVEDEGMFQEEVDWAGDDVHRGHRPQRAGRLVDSNQNVELSSSDAWKVEKAAPRIPGENVLQYTVRVDSAPPHSVESPLYVPSSTAVKVEAPPKLTVNCDGEGEVEIRKKYNVGGDTDAVIRSKLSNDYEASPQISGGGGEYRTSRSKTNELDVSMEIRQYSPIGEDGKCKTYRPRSALSGRSSDPDPNKSNRPQSALSGRVADQETTTTDAQTKTFRPKSALSGRISETDADGGGCYEVNKHGGETINRMPDLLLYSTPKNESVQQEQYRNSEVSYSVVEKENEFNRSDTLRASGTNNRMSLQEGPVVIRPGSLAPQPVSRTPSGKVPPQPPVRKTPCIIGEQRTTSAEIYPVGSSVEAQSVRVTQNAPQHRFVTETFPEALVTSSPINPKAPVRSYVPYVRDQRIVSEIFTEDVPSSPSLSVHNTSARGVSMISPVTSDESYIIPARTTIKPVIQHPKPVFSPAVVTAPRVRSAPPPVAPKKKTGPVALASPEVISPPSTETKQDFMNFNDFLNVVRINEDAEAVEPVSNQSITRQSHVPMTTYMSPPQSYNPSSQTYNLPSQSYNPPPQSYNPPPQSYNPPTEPHNPPPKSDAAFLDFNNFLHIVQDPSASSSNDASRVSASNAAYISTVQGNGNRGDELSREGTRSKSFVEVTQRTAVPSGTRDSFVTEETVYTTAMQRPGERTVIYRDQIFHPASQEKDAGAPGSPGVLISDL